MLANFQWLRATLTDMAQSPFRDVTFDPEKHARIMRRAPAEIRYVIFFTPRSGSSRLTDLAVRTQGLGHPGECFNPAFLPAMAQAHSARNIREYTDLVVRRRQTRGVFGCEVTHMHLVRNFWRPTRFLDQLAPTATFWLIREDIIAQAVSASRMVQTQLAHSVQAKEETDMARAETAFTYQPESIRNVLRRLRWMEAGTEALIRAAGLRPMRLSYEQTIALPPRRLMLQMARHIGAPPRKLRLEGLDSDHRKVSGDKSADFAARFRKEFPDLVARIDRDRAPMLAAHARDRG